MLLVDLDHMSGTIINLFRWEKKTILIQLNSNRAIELIEAKREKDGKAVISVFEEEPELGY